MPTPMSPGGFPPHRAASGMDGAGLAPGTPSLGQVLLIYLGLFAVLTVPFWWQGQVVAPFRPTSEIAAEAHPGPALLENRRLSDYLFQYIPEATAAFDRGQSGWLAVWTNRNELGRPIDHLWGLSPAYLPSWFLFAVSDSPYRFATLLSLGLCVLAGMFVLLWCHEVGLSPLAGLLAGASLAGSPTLIYWLTFPTFNATYCWAAGALYAATRLHRRPDLVGWSVLAFTIYSLLMTGYQQLIVFHAYLLGGGGAWLVYRRWHSSGPVAAARSAAMMTSAVVVGAGLAAPLYLDLVHAASESTRLAPDPSFFVANFPPLATLDDIARFVVLSTFPEVLANPASPGFPFVYNGRSATVVVLFLSVVALLLRHSS